MGFSPPLLYFLTSSLYLNSIWVKNFKKAILMIFICTVLILFHLFSSNQKNQVGQAVFSLYLDEENSDKVETGGLTS